jgi:hypothetical protein
MNPDAANYNPDANIEEHDGDAPLNDDGSTADVCQFDGCTNEEYIEYNPAATVDNEALCLTLNEGCSDEAYEEYNPTATVPNDALCITMTCAGQGFCDLNLYDSYGDGWSGNMLLIDGVGYTIENPDGGNYHTHFHTCVDPTTLNSGLIQCGGNGITDTTDEDYSWVSEISYELDCPGLSTVIAGDGDASGACTVDIGDSTVCVDSLAALSAIEGAGCVPGCTNFMALNYDATATYSDGSCVFPVYGCIDSLANNYNAEANAGDGSCDYAGCVDVLFNEYNENTALNHPDAADVDLCVTPTCESENLCELKLIDSYGDGWNGNVFMLGGVSYGADFTSGSEKIYCVDSAPLSDGSYVCGGGSYTYEISWTFTCPGSGDDEASFASGDALDVSDALASCHANLDVSNVSPDLERCIEWLGACTIPGCLDSAYVEYNPLATESNITMCVTQTCAAQDKIELVLLESYGDGWSGNSLHIFNETYIITNGVNSESYCIEPESLSYTVDSNGDDQLYIWATCGGGLWSKEVGFNVILTNGDVLSVEPNFINPDSTDCGDGVAITDANSFCLTDYCPVEGCMDDAALNYDPEANMTCEDCCEYPTTTTTEEPTIPDCNGNEQPADGLQGWSSLIGDGTCHDTDEINFNCADYSNDGGDCVAVPVQTVADISINVAGSVSMELSLTPAALASGLDNGDIVANFEACLALSLGVPIGFGNRRRQLTNNDATTDPLVVVDSSTVVLFPSSSASNYQNGAIDIDYQLQTTFSIVVNPSSDLSSNPIMSDEITAFVSEESNTQMFATSSLVGQGLTLDNIADNLTGLLDGFTVTSADVIVADAVLQVTVPEDTGNLELNLDTDALTSLTSAPLDELVGDELVEPNPTVPGCTDSTADNYNVDADEDDGSCVVFVQGCTDSAAANYNVDANYDDGSCVVSQPGCMSETALNYNADATVDDGSCEEPTTTQVVTTTSEEPRADVVVTTTSEEPTTTEEPTTPEPVVEEEPEEVAPVVANTTNNTAAPVETSNGMKTATTSMLAMALALLSLSLK